MHPRTQKLRDIMARQGLTAKQVAAILNRRHTTVRLWLTERPWRPIPEHTLRLLESEIAKRGA